MRNKLVLAVGILAACAVYVVMRARGLTPEQAATAAVAVICALYWVAQPIPIPVTSLIPCALFPLLGVTTEAKVAQSYGHHLVLLLMAGFMLSTAIESSGAHRRLAVLMANLVSGSGAIRAHRLLLGFMIAAAFSSMWISNTAATLILLPIAMAASEGVENERLRPQLLLGIAYASSIGGIGTPIGTPPNLLFMATHQELTGESWGFSRWMSLGVPIVVLMLPLAYLILAAPLRSNIVPPLPQLSPPTTKERRVLLIFGLTALAWVFRIEPFGGWTELCGLSGVGDTTVAFTGLLFMFVVPDSQGGTLLTWEDAQRIPWGILLLFGGGIALATGFEQSGLSQTIGSGLGFLARTPPWAMIVLISLVVTFLTEVTSNTATTALLMPILGAAAQAADIRPALLMFPAAVSASCAFMLPVATAPNAIVCGSGHVTTTMMAKNGFLLNMCGVVVISLVCLLLL